MYFSINMSGVEDNVENYQTYLISCSTVIVFKSYGILFFVLSLISRSLLWFSCSIMLSLTFYFHCAYFSWLYKCLIGRLFDRRPDKLLSRTLYGIRVAAQSAKKMPWIMHYLHHYQIIEREPASWPAYQTKRYHASKLTRRMQSSEAMKRQDGALATLTNVKYV